MLAQTEYICKYVPLWAWHSKNKKAEENMNKGDFVNKAPKCVAGNAFIEEPWSGREDLNLI